MSNMQVKSWKQDKQIERKKLKKSKVESQTNQPSNDEI
jgi:hypothetical protein